MNDPLAEFIFWMTMLFLWWFFHWPLREYQIDRARHYLYALEVRLLEAAVERKHFRYGDRTYTRIREILRAMSNQVDGTGVLGTLFISYCTQRKPQWESAVSYQMDEIEREIEILSPEGQKIVRDIMHDARHVLVRCAMWCSLSGVLLGAVLHALRPMERVLGPNQFIRKISQSFESKVCFNATVRSLCSQH